VRQQRERLNLFVEQHLTDLQTQPKKYMARLVAEFNEANPENPTTENIMRDACTKYRAEHNIEKVYFPNKYYLRHSRQQRPLSEASSSEAAAIGDGSNQ
jgi:hypothetical protein